MPGLGRFRCNVFQQRGTIGMVLRVIPVQVRTLDELGLPPVLQKIAPEERGLVLVTGTTGSGKSTTLAAMVDHINNHRSAHIITIEDPIEFLHRDNLSIINQREIGVDTRSFAFALRSALRQDPDVILVGEMRDHGDDRNRRCIAAETGHLVFSTLHTLDATETINRIISVFPPHQQKQIRLQLSSVLKAVDLAAPGSRASTATAACPRSRCSIATAFISDCIVDKEKTHLIQGAIAAGTSQYGMQTFDQSIFSLLRQGLVSLRRGAALGDQRRRVQAQESRASRPRPTCRATRWPARSSAREPRRAEETADARNHAVREIDTVPVTSSSSKFVSVAKSRNCLQLPTNLNYNWQLELQCSV